MRETGAPDGGAEVPPGARIGGEYTGNHSGDTGFAGGAKYSGDIGVVAGGAEHFQVKRGNDMAGERILWGVGTGRTLRAHWALIELGLEYRCERIAPRSPEMLAAAYGRLDPRHKAPVLEDGDLVVAESAAIITWLAETCPGPPRLIPERGPARAGYFEWMSFICMELDATSLYVLRRHEALTEVYGDAPAANTAARGYFARMIDAATEKWEHGRTRPWLLGEEFSGVDILMTTCLDWAIGYEAPVPDAWLPYIERAHARPAHAEAVAANQVP